jgi:hypothetical protein
VKPSTSRQGLLREKRSPDDIAVIEIMTETIDRGWWADFRRRVEQEFDQEEIMIRCHKTEQL